MIDWRKEQSLTVKLGPTGFGANRVVDVVDETLELIEARNDSIHAFTDVLVASAREEAAEVAKNSADGPMRGIPVGVKDIIDTRGAVCSAGQSFLGSYVPEEDSDVVRALRDGGAIIVGVTASDPGAFDVRTPAVAHPADNSLTVGGSSGGSAAAVAAGMVPVALGTDTGGSVRIPAACCGITGFKPTFGRLSTRGVRPLAWSLDHVGVLARCVEDVICVQQVLDPGLRWDGAVSAGVEGATIGIDWRYFNCAAKSILTGVEKVIGLCESLGAHVVPVCLPSPEESLERHLVIFCSEAAAYHLDVFPDRLREYSETAQMLLSQAERQRGYEYVRAMNWREARKKQLARIFDEVDFVILPTLPVEPPRRRASSLQLNDREVNFTSGMIRYTHLFNHTGNPVLSVPLRESGLKVKASVQVVGRMGGDAHVLRFGRDLEKHLDASIASA